MTSTSHYSVASADDLIRNRLVNHKLAGSALRDPRDVVAWFGAVQAQDFPGAKWAVGLRTAAATDARVEGVFNGGAILRTHVLRPTWHFVTAADIRWLVALSGPRLLSRLAYRYRQLELDRRTIAKSGATLERALSKAELTRREIAAALERAGIPITPERTSHLLMIAELEGRICSGPLRDRQLTYALMDRRVPPADPPGREEMLARLADRYFRSHGPATLADFCWWSGLTVRDATTALAAAGSRLSTDTRHPGTYRHSDGGQRTRAPRAAWLLPNFDEYLVAYRHRAAILAGDHVDPADALASTVVVDGRAVGTWRLRRDEDSLTVSVAAWRLLSRTELDRIAAAAARYGAFVGRPVTFERPPRSAPRSRRSG